MPRRNLALELLQKLLADEIKTRFRRNVVESRRFSEMLAAAMRQYQNRALTSAQVIEELIDLARELREAHRRGQQLGLSEDELAFYDALETNDSAVTVLGDETLKQIAQELVCNGAAQRHDRLDPARKRPRQACASWSSACCASMAIRPTSRRRRRSSCWSRPSFRRGVGVCTPPRAQGRWPTVAVGR